MPRASEFNNSVYRYGDWKRARSVFGGLAFRLQNAADRGMKAEAQGSVNRIRNNIFKQAYDHAPLSDWQREAKAAEGKDPRILIEDKDYVNAIQAFHMGRGVYGVGIAAGDEENIGKGLMHEWGGVNNLGHVVPARPHYRVELERIRSSGLGSLKESMRKALVGSV